MDLIAQKRRYDDERDMNIAEAERRQRLKQRWKRAEKLFVAVLFTVFLLVIGTILFPFLAVVVYMHS